MQQDVSGSVRVDGQPVDGAEIALLDPSGRTVAATHSDAAGRFAFAAAAPPRGLVVAKLHVPMIGAACATLEAPGSVALAATACDAATLTASIELPAGADPAGWFDVEVTPIALAGVPAEAVKALTLDGVGPARHGNYHTVRVTEPRMALRLSPGSWDLKISHIVERGKPVRPPPPNWIGGHVTLPDGTQVAADLGSIRVEVTRDLEVRVAMQVFTD